MKQVLSALLFLALFGHSQQTFSQENKKEQIAKHLTDYFFLERENIHVHLDKNVFMTHEQVWFKGYVFHRKKNTPFFSTVNMYASLIDSEGKIIETKLVYANIGSFVGDFKLENLKSGKYYLQFYTNWMNNFAEDDSAVYEIAVINQTEGSGTALAKADPSKINIAFRPEGGTLVSGIANTIGISIADCNDNPLAVSEADIADGSGKVLLKVQLNKKGYGKFELPANAAGCKAIVVIDGTKFEQPLPLPQARGIALDINNLQDKTIVRVKTNKYTAEAFAGKPLYLLLHQDEQAAVYELSFKNGATEQTFALPAAELFEGINTIRILDSDLNELASRLFFKYPKESLATEFSTSKESVEKHTIKGKINYPYMNLSISALPENNIALGEANDIYSSFLLMPYIKGHKAASGRYYLSNATRGKMYELDLYLLSQEAKYEWRNIAGTPPSNAYPFDMGLTVKGTLPKNAGETKMSKIRIYSLTSVIDEITEIDDKKEFLFNNMVVPDSTYVNFKLLRKGQEPKELTVAPIVTNGNRKFNKPYKPRLKYYAQSAAVDLSLPSVQQETTMLEEVKIEAQGLKFANSFGNGNLRGYKISDMRANMYQNLLNFISTYGGFDVSDREGNVTIYSRTTNSINGAQNGPIIYIDNVQLFDYTMLKQIQMSEVEEVYMSAHAIVPSVRNYMGIIRVYLKKGAKAYNKNAYPEILLKGGFERIVPFENVTYTSTSDKGFENFGVIAWHPLLMTDENGNFEFNLPKTGQKTMKVIIEGFSADGKLTSEIKTMPAN